MSCHVWYRLSFIKKLQCNEKRAKPILTIRTWADKRSSQMRSTRRRCTCGPSSSTSSGRSKSTAWRWPSSGPRTWRTGWGWRRCRGGCPKIPKYRTSSIPAATCLNQSGINSSSDEITCEKLTFGDVHHDGPWQHYQPHQEVRHAQREDQ